MLDVRLVNGTWLEAHFCEIGVAGSSFLVLGALILRIVFISIFVTYRLNTCLVIQYPRYSICSAKCLDLEEMFTLIPVFESLARTISNLSRWSLKLIFVIINKSSR
jgi:hypothetical protein